MLYDNTFVINSDPGDLKVADADRNLRPRGRKHITPDLQVEDVDLRDYT